MELDLEKIYRLFDEDTIHSNTELVFYLKGFLINGNKEEKEKAEEFFEFLRERVLKHVANEIAHMDEDEMLYYQLWNDMGKIDDLVEENEENDLVKEDKKNDSMKKGFSLFKNKNKKQIAVKEALIEIAEKAYDAKEYVKAEKCCVKVLKSSNNKEECVKAHELLGRLYCYNHLNKDYDKSYAKGIEHMLMIKDEPGVQCFLVAEYYYHKKRDVAEAIKYYIKEFETFKYIRDLEELAEIYKKNEYKLSQERLLYKYYELYYDYKENLRDEIYESAKYARSYFGSHIVGNAEAQLGIYDPFRGIPSYGQEKVVFVLPYNYREYDIYQELLNYLNENEKVSIGGCIRYLDSKKELIAERTKRKQDEAIDIAMKKQGVMEEQKRTQLLQQQNELYKKNYEMSEKNYRMNEQMQKKIASELNSIKWRL